MSDPIREEVEADEVTLVSRRPSKTAVEPNYIAQETGPENEEAPAKPLVVRTLKAPPEIWDMVHEAPEHFNPGGAFVARLTSSKTKLALLTLTVTLISGLCAFAIMTLSEGTRDGAAAQVQEEPVTSQTVPASQASAAESAPAGASNAPVDAQTDTALGAESGSEFSVDNTQPTAPEPAIPQPTDQEADDPVTADHSLSNSVQPTGVSVSNISKRAASGAGGVLSGTRRVTVASVGPDAERPTTANKESETAAAPDTTAAPQKPQAPQTLQTSDIKRSDEKSSGDSASANKRSDTASSPPATAPPATSSAPKAKVIQWP